MKRRVYAKWFSVILVVFILTISVGFLVVDEVPDINEGSKAFIALNEVLLRIQEKASIAMEVVFPWGSDANTMEILGS